MIDTTLNTVVNTIVVGDLPVGVAVAPDGKRVYVTNVDSGSVSVIDTTLNTVVETISVSSPSNGLGPDNVAVAPDGKRVYMTSGNSNSFAVIDTTTTPNTVVGTGTVGIKPTGVAVSPDGKRVYVTDGLSNSVSVIDTTFNTVVDTVAVGEYPVGIAIQQLPTSKDQCKNDGWKTFGFKNQGQCIKYVNTGVLGTMERKFRLSFCQNPSRI